MKARDLRGKNIEDIEETSQDPKEDEDAVAAAYENISKRLESIRGGKHSSDEGESEESNESEESDVGLGKGEPELTEWKGPRPPKKEELKPVKDFDEEDHDLRKVKLDSDAGAKNSDDDEEEIDPLDDDDDDDDVKVSKGSDESKVEKPKEEAWEPEENDPLDEEEGDDIEEGESGEATERRSDEDVEDDVEKRTAGREETAVMEDEPMRPLSERGREEMESLHSEAVRPEVSDSSDMPEDRTRFTAHEDERGPGPDSLEDLTGNRDENEFSEGSRGMREEEELPYRKAAREGDDDYSIPSLRGSGQSGSHMGYNAHPQRESFGQSYSPKGNMDGNDPNNFFSSHANQAPKRANKFHLLVLVIIGIAVIGFTVYVLKGGFGGINLGISTEASPSPSVATATPEPTPTPTPEPEVERGNYTVKVLNGTSTSGLARTVSDKLKETGYKTATPGNASDDDVEQTEIRVKEGSESAALFERLKLDLAPDYEAVQGEELDEDTAHDVEVIIGAK